jgi:hypothetical protein
MVPARVFGWALSEPAGQVPTRSPGRPQCGTLAVLSTVLTALVLFGVSGRSAKHRFWSLLSSTANNASSQEAALSPFLPASLPGGSFARLSQEPVGCYPEGRLLPRPAGYIGSGAGGAVSSPPRRSQLCAA